MLDFSSTVKSAIMIYTVLIILTIVYKPKLLQDNRRSQSLLSIAVIVLSILSYYSLAVMRWFRGG